MQKTDSVFAEFYLRNPVSQYSDNRPFCSNLWQAHFRKLPKLSDRFDVTFQFSHISDVGLDENNAVRAVLGLKLPDSIFPLPNIHIANSHILQQVTGRIP
jgi:hypothetical protein